MSAKFFKLAFTALVLAGLALWVSRQTPELPYKTQAASGLPVRLEIPSISVDATIEPVGLLANGSMDVPQVPSDTAWYQSGTRPGEIGSAVIDGHVDWYFGATAVFTDLKNLKTGDRLTVLDRQGNRISFVVRKTQTYSSTADATEVFTSRDNLAHLNLITCQGDWDKIARSYSQRLVVFTDKE